MQAATPTCDATTDKAEHLVTYMRRRDSPLGPYQRHILVGARGQPLTAQGSEYACGFSDPIGGRTQILFTREVKFGTMFDD